MKYSGKKLIELGWDIPTTQYMKVHWQEMEKTTPFDGVMFEVMPANETVGGSQSLMTDKPWDKALFASCIDDLKACKFTQFTDNFIRVNFSPGTVAWQDDAGWKNVCDKVAICSWISKEGGCKGLAPDFESYGKHMFKYDADSGLTYEQTRDLAFKRGAQFVEAVAKYQPNAVLLCLWMNSINTPAGRCVNPETALRNNGYGLLPAFINGMLSAVPKEMILVDGCEFGYYYDGDEQYQRASLDMLLWSGPCMRLVLPELRKTYRTQVQAGFGFYLDMYSNEKGNKYYRAAHEGETRVDRLAANLTSAMKAADEYVWVYGEKHRWWNLAEAKPRGKNPKPAQFWNDALENLTQRIWEIKDPVKAARIVFEKYVKDGKLNNVLNNADFAKKDSKTAMPDGWRAWQLENQPQGTLYWDGSIGGGVAAMKDVRNGCLMQSITVKPGEFYYFKTEACTCGNSSVVVRLRWQNDKGWTKENLDPILSPVVVGKSGNTTNYAFEGTARVPEDGTKMVVLLSVSDQTAPTDRAWFDNVVLCKIR
ncbi:MAG: hypothetical protein Q4G59_06315 [Planctomycetia bacterium]|nr:hypothetical protein [Planctomycetia bacterium]